jgi:hypothetical protein
MVRSLILRAVDERRGRMLDDNLAKLSYGRVVVEFDDVAPRTP